MEYNNYVKRFTAEMELIGLVDEKEPWHIAAYSGNYIAKTGHFLPIEMQFLECTLDGYKIDPAALVYPLPSLDEDNELYFKEPINFSEEFCQDYVNILHGRNPEWFLAKFSPTMSGICLEFCNKSLEHVEELYLNIVRTVNQRHAKLDLQFNVPHARNKSDTEYTFHSQCFWYPRNGGKAPQTAILLEYAMADRYGIMTFGTDSDVEVGCNKDTLLNHAVYSPDYASVEECIDV